MARPRERRYWFSGVHSWCSFNHAPSHENINLFRSSEDGRGTDSCPPAARAVGREGHVRTRHVPEQHINSRVCAISQTHSMSPFYNRISFPIMSVRSGLFRQTHSLSHPTLTPLLASTLSIVHRRAATYHISARPTPSLTRSLVLVLLLTLSRSRRPFLCSVSCLVASLRGPYHWLYTCYTVLWTGSIACVDVAPRRRR